MEIKSSLQKKFLAFFLLYTMVLLGSILIYFGYTSRNQIVEQSVKEVRSAIRFFDKWFGKELQGAVSEIGSLHSRLDVAGIKSFNSEIAGVPVQREMKSFLSQYALKYSEILIHDSDSEACVRFYPVKEMGEYDIGTETRHVCPFQITQPVYSDTVITFPVQQGKYDRVIPITAGPSPAFPFMLTGKVHVGQILQQVQDQLFLPEVFEIFLMDRAGTIIYSHQGAHLNRLMKDVLNSGYAIHQLGENASVIREAGYVEGFFALTPEMILLIRKHIQPQLYLWRSRIFGIIGFCGGLSFLLFLLIWSVTRRISRSLQDVVQAATEVADGNFSHKLKVKSQDELGVLLHAFNEMTSRLEEKISELTSTRRELSQKQRLALLGEAISKISHEIQNRVGGVSVWVQNLERVVRDDQKACDYVLEVKNALASFMDMMVHFKRFYRAPMLDFKGHSVKDLVDGSLMRVGKDLTLKNQEAEVRMDSEACRIPMDFEQMTDALVNLLLNAIYYTPEGGVIRVECQKSDDAWILRIKDDGPGLRPDQPEHLFEPFFTTKRSGSGLGLAIVQNIVHAHRGTVRAFNHADGGACFEIRLPRFSEPLEATEG